VDICVEMIDVDKIRKVLLDTAQETKLFYVLDDFLPFENPLLFRLAFDPMKEWIGEIWVDLYGYKRNETQPTIFTEFNETRNRTGMMENRAGNRDNWKWDMELEDLFPLRRLNYCKNRMFLAPLNETAVLMKRYGLDFRTEKIFGARKWKCALLPL